MAPIRRETPVQSLDHECAARTRTPNPRIKSDDIDTPVAITEAAELARRVSTDDSPRYLNGVLGRIAEYATN
jgi:hypothetical protein